LCPALVEFVQKELVSEIHLDWGSIIQFAEWVAPIVLVVKSDNKSIRIFDF